MKDVSTVNILKGSLVYFAIVGLLIILRIGLFICFVVSEGQYLAPDSSEYINLATNLLDHQVFSSSLQPPFELNFFRTPGYPFFLAVLKYLNVGTPYWVIFWQELLYAFSLWLFYHYGQPLFGKSITCAGLLFLLIEPGGFAYPKLILSEILFLPFITMALLLIGHYLKKRNLRYLVLSGFIMGLGVLVRPALLYLPIIICLTLVVFNFRCKKQWLHSGLLLLTVALTISPWLVRNFHYSDEIFISGQQSNVLANYHVPYVWESARGIPFREGQKIIANNVDIAVKRYEQHQGQALTKIERYKVQQDIAFNELTKYPMDYSERWVIGIAKAMAGMNLTLLNFVFKIQPSEVSFDSIQESRFFNKVWQYLTGQDKLALFFLIFRGLIAIFALLGTLTMFKSKDCFLWIIILSNFYFICSAGPAGLARFRFPIEVFWFIQACYGFKHFSFVKIMK